MNLNYQDKGNYFRGLLILIGKDNIIDDKEKKRILEICNRLGYDSKFCDEAVNNFLENEFINLNPPQFSSKKVATQFLKDAIGLSLVDNDFHADELVWIEKVASKNKISNEWLDKELNAFIKNYIPNNSLSLEDNSVKVI